MRVGLSRIDACYCNYNSRRVSETERRKKKVPLYKKLEMQARARLLEIEKEKVKNIYNIYGNCRVSMYC